MNKYIVTLVTIVPPNNMTFERTTTVDAEDDSTARVRAVRLAGGEDIIRLRVRNYDLSVTEAT